MSDIAELYARLYLDQDVPVQLAGMLRAKGFDVVTTLEADMLGAQDSDQLDFAVGNERAIITLNREDFEALHEEWLEQGKSHFGIIVSPHHRYLSQTRDRIVDLLNRVDRAQLKNLILFA